MHFPASGTARTGFTLIEILITAAVISVLAALLIAAATRVRDQASSARCLANLRGVGNAAIHYINDHEGRFPPSKFWYSRMSWEKLPGIRDYLGFHSTSSSSSEEFHVDSILTCPTLKALCPKKFPNMLNRCYSVNRYFIANDPNYPNDLDAPPNPGSPRRIANVPNVSKMWIFTDGTTTNPQNGSEFGTMVSYSHVSNDQILYPHSGHQHAVFLDGHVEKLSSQQFKDTTIRREFWGDVQR